jgi:nucleoside-diphosphate-sugar epimerase
MYNKYKNILVTGATGLIGFNLVKFLLENTDAKVIALSRNKNKLEQCFSKYLNSSSFSYIEQDISKEFLFPDEIDCIFHAAGNIAGDLIKETPVDIIKPNLMGLINCLEYLRIQKRKNHTCRLVELSSATVYGEKSGKYTENETTETGNIEETVAPYFESKRMCEVICNAYNNQYGLDTVRVRLGYVYGPCFFMPNTAFYQFILQIIKKETINSNIISIKASKVMKRDNIFVDDAVNGLISVAYLGSSGDVYNISSNGYFENNASIDEMAKVLADIAGGKVLYESKDFCKLPGILLDNSKLKSLGWTAKTSLYDGIKKTFDYYKM